MTTTHLVKGDKSDGSVKIITFVDGQESTRRHWTAKQWNGRMGRHFRDWNTWLDGKTFHGGSEWREVGNG